MRKKKPTKTYALSMTGVRNAGCGGVKWKNITLTARRVRRPESAGSGGLRIGLDVPERELNLLAQDRIVERFGGHLHPALRGHAIVDKAAAQFEGNADTNCVFRSRPSKKSKRQTADGGRPDKRAPGP